MTPSEVEVIETDRSRSISYQSCPRQRYLAYHHLGRGLQKKAKALPLQFGAAFHEGAEDLLMGIGVESAVLRARLFLSNQFEQAKVGFDGETPDDFKRQFEYGAEEQAALSEALLRGWWEWEGEAFLKGFEVIECEREGRANLLDDMVWMFRPDALVRDRMSDDLFVVSWKTCATFTKRTVDQARHDMQSISEVWGLQQEYKIKPEGVLYKFMVKGKRSKDDWDGLYKQNSPLIYGWKRVGPSGADEDIDWAHCYSWKTEEINEKTGKAKGTTLGKGWKKVPIWQEYPGGVKQWIEDLAKQRIAPRHINALAEAFPQAMPVERRADEVEEWRQQTIQQELKIAQALHPIMYDSDLVVDFPKHTHSCHSYSGCPFIPICWESAPAEPGELYQIRVSNHPEQEDEDGEQS